MKFKNDEKYVKRRTVLTVFLGQAITLSYFLIFLYGFMV